MPVLEFQTLPLEIRQITYDFALGNINLVEYYIVPRIRQRHNQKRRKVPSCRKDRLGIFTVSAHGRWPELLVVSRQVRRELFELIFARATFKLTCHHPNIVIPDRIRTDIELVHCGLIDSCCRKDIYSFSNLRRLTCQLYFDDPALRDYGYTAGFGPETKAELEAMITYGLDPDHENHWTLVDAGYPFVMEIFRDVERVFSMRIMATAAWAVDGPEYFHFTETVMDIDSMICQEVASEQS